MKTTRKQPGKSPILEVESEDTNQGIALAFEPGNLIGSPDDPPKKEDDEGQGEDESGQGGGSADNSGGTPSEDGRPKPNVGVGVWSMRP